MGDRPTVHLTNFASRKLHGPGWLWTIMRRPRHWERGKGRVDALTPHGRDLDAIRAGAISWDEYATRCVRHFSAFDLAPGVLVAEGQEPVRDGDTLCCSCSREAAARGECHRVIAARLLEDAGWNVILDGVAL